MFLVWYVMNGLNWILFAGGQQKLSVFCVKNVAEKWWTGSFCSLLLCIFFKNPWFKVVLALFFIVLHIEEQSNGWRRLFQKKIKNQPTQTTPFVVLEWRCPLLFKKDKSDYCFFVNFDQKGAQSIIFGRRFGSFLSNDTCSPSLHLSLDLTCSLLSPHIIEV